MNGEGSNHQQMKVRSTEQGVLNFKYVVVHVVEQQQLLDTSMYDKYFGFTLFHLNLHIFITLPTASKIGCTFHNASHFCNKIPKGSHPGIAIRR